MICASRLSLDAIETNERGHYAEAQQQFEAALKLDARIRGSITILVAFSNNATGNRRWIIYRQRLMHLNFVD